MLDFIKNRLANWIDGSKSSLGGSEFLTGRDHSYKIDSMKAYASEGYMANPTVYGCIDLVATAFARVPIKVKNAEGEHLVDSPFQALLNHPNPDEGGVEFRNASASWMLLAGNNFTERLMNSDGVPTEMWNWQPYEMSIARNKGGRIPSHYVYRKDQDGRREWEVDQITGLSDMLHWRFFNPQPNGSGLGMSPLSSGAYSVDSYNAHMKWRYNSAKNGGTLDGILSAKGNGSMTDPQRKDLERKFKEKYTGADRAGKKLAISATEMTFTSLSTSMRDAEWLGGTKLNKQEICEAFKVPTQLLGIEGSQTYANFQQATKALYYLAVIPLLDLYCSEMNRWMGGFFPDQYVCYDKSDIHALESDRAQRRLDKINSGSYSINEIRREFGDEDREEPEADSVMTDPSKIPLGMDVFAGLGENTADVAKALMRAGLSRVDAETKALEWVSDSED